MRRAPDRDLTLRFAKATGTALAVVAPAARIWQEGSILFLLMSVAVVGVLFGGFAIVLAVPFTSAVATLIDVLVLGHDPPAAEPRRSLRLTRSG